MKIATILTCVNSTVMSAKIGWHFWHSQFQAIHQCWGEMAFCPEGGATPPAGMVGAVMPFI